jgi:hypothetical protein
MSPGRMPGSTAGRMPASTVAAPHASFKGQRSKRGAFQTNIEVVSRRGRCEPHLRFSAQRVRGASRSGKEWQGAGQLMKLNYTGPSPKWQRHLRTLPLGEGAARTEVRDAGPTGDHWPMFRRAGRWQRHVRLFRRAGCPALRQAGMPAATCGGAKGDSWGELSVHRSAAYQRKRPGRGCLPGRVI